MSNPIQKYGLLGAAAVVFYFAIAYTSGKENFLNPVVQWLPMVVYVAMMYRAAGEDVAANGIGRDFRELTRTPFAVFLIINLAYWMFYYGLHLFDNQLLVLQNAQQLAQMKAELTAGTGDPERSNLLRTQIQELENETAQSMPLAPVVLRMAMGAVGGFALAAGVVGVLKMRD